MSSNNYSMILIYYLPPAFFPKTLHNFPSLWFKRKCSYICELKVLCGHFLHQWTIQITYSSGVRAWKSQWPTSCLPGPSSNPLTHGSAPSPSETGKFLDLRLFFSFLSNTSKFLAKKKKKKSPIFYTILITLHFFSQILFSCFLAVIHTGAWHRTYSVALY